MWQVTQPSICASFPVQQLGIWERRSKFPVHDLLLYVSEHTFITGIWGRDKVVLFLVPSWSSTTKIDFSYSRFRAHEFLTCCPTHHWELSLPIGEMQEKAWSSKPKAIICTTLTLTTTFPCHFFGTVCVGYCNAESQQLAKAVTAGS